MHNQLPTSLLHKRLSCCWREGCSWLLPSASVSVKQNVSLKVWVVCPAFFNPPPPPLLCTPPPPHPHTSSIAFRTFLQTLPELIRPLKGALFIDAQLSTYAVSALWKIWVRVTRLWKQHSIEACMWTWGAPAPDVKRDLCPFKWFWFCVLWCKQCGFLPKKYLIQFEFVCW